MQVEDAASMSSLTADDTPDTAAAADDDAAETDAVDAAAASLTDARLPSPPTSAEPVSCPQLAN